MVQGLPWILIWKNWPNIRFSNRAGLALSYHNLRVGGSNPAPATIKTLQIPLSSWMAVFFVSRNCKLKYRRWAPCKPNSWLTAAFTWCYVDPVYKRPDNSYRFLLRVFIREKFNYLFNSTLLSMTNIGMIIDFNRRCNLFQ